MERRNWRALIVGFAGAFALIAGLLAVVGAGDVLGSLSTADPPLVAASVGCAVLWLGAWGFVLRTVLGTLGVEIATGRSLLVYAAAAFANNVTPFGQAGGEPIAALLISKVSDARYETGLAGIATVDALNVVSSLSLIAVGVGYYATTATVGGRLAVAVQSAVVLVAIVALVLYLVWRYQETIIVRLSRVIAAAVVRLPVGGSDRDAIDEDISQRLRRFFAHIERMAVQRRRLAAAFGLSALGWLLQAAALLAAFAALGHSVPPSVLIFVIPLGNLAGATPLPGGLGGIEAAFVALLVPTTGLPAATVTAAVVIYRGAIYWLPVIIGGGSMAAFGARTVA